MTDLVKDLREIAAMSHNDFRETTNCGHFTATAQKAADDIELMRGLLREAWMITAGDRSPSYLREFHDRLDARAHELRLRLPR